MARTITIYSFADVDRSGKARWAACELAYEIEEQRVKPGDHRADGYMALNPYAQVPTAVIDGETWIESTAICLMLAERHPEAGLIPSDPGLRRRFWQQVNLASSSLEAPAVHYYLSSLGFIDERWQELLGDDLKGRLRTYADSVPEQGYWCEAFSVADICAAYVLRLGLQAGLLNYEGRLAAYFDLLRARPAAVASRMFDSL